MWVVSRVLGLEVGQMAAHHGDELRCILEGVDAHERRVVTCLDVTKGASLDGMGPFKVAPELYLGQYPPATVRLESLRAVPMGTRGMRYEIGQLVGEHGDDRVRSMRRRSRRKLVPIG